MPLVRVKVKIQHNNHKPFKDSMALGSLLIDGKNLQKGLSV